MTLPLLPSTFPKRTAAKIVSLRTAIPSMISSEMRLVAPITLVGLTALSLEIKTKRSTPNSSAAFAVIHVPLTLFVTASQGFSSIIGTCLWAAAWKMVCGASRRSTSARRVRSVTSPTIGLTCRAYPPLPSSCAMV